MSRYLLLACVLACPCGDARAEVSFGIVSDFRYRGLSLTDGDPAVQAGFAWDHDAGWYAGVSAASTRIGGERGLQAVSWLGRAWRLDSGRSWETGIQQVAISNHASDYGELYLGLVSDRWSARAYYQPDAFGNPGSAVYAEFDAGIPLGERWRLLGHLGAQWLGSDPGPYVDRLHYDGRFGVGVAVGATHLHLQRVFTARRGAYPAYGLAPDAADAGWVLGATWTW